MSRGQFGKPGVYNATPITLADQESSAVSLDSTGATIVSPATGASFGASSADGSTFTQGTTTGGISMGVYVASPQTLTTGKAGAVALDINRNLMVSLASLIAGEDLTNNVLKVEQRFTNANIITATTTTIKSGAGYVDEVIVVGGTLGNVTIYDNIAASGTVLCPTVTPVSGAVILKHCTFATGLTIITVAATGIVISYR